MQVPKYKVYEGRRAAIDGSIIPSDYGPWFDEDYPGYEFLKSNYLWNYDKVYPRLFFGKEAELLVIVEGFKACIWSLQCGFRNSVALMGSSMSERQKELILRVDTRVVLFLDNNSAGRIGTLKIGTELQKAMPTVWVALYPQGAGEGCQPDDLEPELVQEAIRSAAPFRFWRRERNFV
jgi:DNA primase